MKNIYREPILALSTILLLVVSVAASMVMGHNVQPLTFPGNETTENTIPQSESDGGRQNAVWPMYKNDARHTGRSPYDTGNNPGGERWKYFTSCPLWTVTPVIDSNGTIYISSWNKGLHAIYPNGTRKWQRDLVGYHKGYTPAIGLDGTIYVGTSERFHALYPNGTIRWIFPVENRFCSRPTVDSDGIIYVGTDDGCLYALYLNGTVKWEYHIDAYIIATSVDAAGNVYFTARYDDYLYCLNPNGILQWKFDVKYLVFDAPLIADDGTIYISAVYYLIAINPDGTEKWRIPSNGEGCSPSLAPDGTIIYSPFTPEVLAIDPDDGHVQWVYTVDGDPRWKTSAVVGSDGAIYFAFYYDDKEDYGYLGALTPDGKLKWETRLTSDIQPYNGMDLDANPSIGADGTVYVTTWFRSNVPNYYDYGYVHAIGGGKIRNIQEGYLYLFGYKLIKTIFRNTVIIGAIDVIMDFFHPENLEKAEILIDDNVLCNMTSPPFEYTIDTRLIGWHTLEIRGYYNDDTVSSEKMKIFFFIL